MQDERARPDVVTVSRAGVVVAQVVELGGRVMVISPLLRGKVSRKVYPDAESAIAAVVARALAQGSGPS